LTTSSGAYVPADEKFVEILTEFQIISSRQCEDRKFISLVDKEEFSSEIAFTRYATLLNVVFMFLVFIYKSA
jgi:hypothetical protein